MAYSEIEIAVRILEWSSSTEQKEVRYCIDFCLGYFGAITEKIWRVIQAMVKAELLTW